MTEEKLSPKDTLTQFLYRWKKAWGLKDYTGLIEFSQLSYIKSLERPEERRKIAANTNPLNSTKVPENAQEYLALLYNSIQIMDFKDMSAPHFPGGPAYCEIMVTVTFRARYGEYNVKYRRNLTFNLIAENADGLADGNGAWGVNPPSAYRTLIL